MARYAFNKIYEQCEKVGKYIKKYVDDISVPWILAEKQYEKKLFSFFVQYTHIVEAMPEKWLSFLLGEYGGYCLLGKPRLIRRCPYIKPENMSDEEKEIYNHFKSNEWFYSFFVVIKDFKNYFLEIKDVITEKEYLLFSRSVSDLFQRGKTFFFSLLLDSGECLQTYGIVHGFFELSLEDIEYYTSLISITYSKGENLYSRIDEFIKHYYLLDTIQEVKGAIIKGTTKKIEHCWGVIDIENFNLDLLQKDWEIKEKNEIYRIENKFKNGMFAPVFYYDSKEKSGILKSLNYFDYICIKSYLENIFSIRYLEECKISYPMDYLIRNLGKNTPYMKYETLFIEEEESNEDEDADLEETNRILSELITAYNNGIELTNEEIMERCETNNLELIIELRKVILSKVKRPFDNIEGGIQGHNPIPPKIKILLDHPFSSCPILKFSKNENIVFEIDSRMKDFYSRIPKSINSVEEKISHIFKKYSGMKKNFVLNYFTYLLILYGDKYHNISEYAIEVLKSFGHILYEKPTKTNTKKFILFFAEVIILSIFYPCGLVDLEDDSILDKSEKELKALINKGISIKTTDIFKRWVELEKNI